MAKDRCVHGRDYPCPRCETTRIYEEKVMGRTYSPEEARERFVEEERLRKRYGITSKASEQGRDNSVQPEKGDKSKGGKWSRPREGPGPARRGDDASGDGRPAAGLWVRCWAG
jgi:hypothetical protein